MKISLGLLFALVVSGSAIARTWTEAESGRTIEAELLSVSDDRVTLQRSDGRTVTIPVASLSETDREFVAAAPAGAAVAAGGADWPTWRGPDRSNRSPDTGLLKEWPEGGPKLAWTFRDAGKGYSAPAIVDGRIYVTGSRGGEALVICLDAAKGEELWSAGIGPDPESGYSTGWGGGTRGAPTVSDGKVYAMSANGALGCFETADGSRVWSKHLVDDFGGKVPNWGYAESPLADGGRIVVTPGGKDGAIVALDPNSGKVLWRSAELTDGAQYASVIVAEVGGRKQYVQLFQNNLAGVDAESGDLIWESEWPEGRTAVIPTPIYHDGRVYMTSGYGGGSRLLDITGGEVEELWKNKVMKNHHGGVVRVDDHLYGFSDGGGLTCQSWETGDRVWSERGRGIQKGAVHYADGMIYGLDEATAEVFLAEASPAEYRERGRFTLPETTELREGTKGQVWTHPVVLNGRLYLRDQDLLFCFDVSG